MTLPYPWTLNSCKFKGWNEKMQDRVNILMSLRQWAKLNLLMKIQIGKFAYVGKMLTLKGEDEFQKVSPLPFHITLSLIYGECYSRCDKVCTFL